MKLIRQWLYEPRIKGVNVDDESLLSIHSSILREKKLLRSAFENFYNDMAYLCDKHFQISGTEVELGTGAGFFKSLRPSLVTSDIRNAPNIDKKIDAHSMDLLNNSVRCIYAINVFHHIADPDKFFNELMRVLAPGGGCILIEPHGGFASAKLHTYLHSDEHFNASAQDWKNVDIGGPLSGANQALSHIVFRRDLNKFNELYGVKLKIIERQYSLNSLRYLFSGGLNFRQLLPSFLELPLIAIEKLFSPIAKLWTLHEIIVIKKL